MGASVRRIALFALIQLVFLAACGGGSSDLASGSGSGTGGSGSSGPTIASPAANVVSLTVDGGPATSPNFNIPYITVTVCAPGSTTNCQTIDHIEVDTASYGLRIISSVLNANLLAALPAETTGGAPLAECVEFGDGYSWGSMRTADLTISSEKAANIPMQVLGDPNLPTAPDICKTSNMTQVEEDTVDSFGANGIVGLGPFAQDCGEGCVQTAGTTFYYTCPSGSGTCQPSTATLAQQTTNPVVAFAADNNGVIVELPTISDSGAMSASGALVFGIGTEGNNSLGSAVVLTTDSNNGNFSVTFGGNSYQDSFVDSGSNLIYFDLNNGSTVSIPECTISSQSFYCPTSQQSLTAVNTGLNGIQSTVTFKVANAQTIFNTAPASYAAFDNLAAPNGTGSAFDFGLPFFYGRNVFTAIQGMNTPGGMGPYVAY